MPGKRGDDEADAAAGGQLLHTKKKKLTLRQQRQQQSDQKHLWPQHANIRDAAAREKAYLRTAGLLISPSSNNSSSSSSSAKVTVKASSSSSSSSKSKKQPIAELDPQLDLNSPQVKFGRLLGATDQRVRHRAVLQLAAYLKQRSNVTNGGGGGLSELDLLKLWKGLWHTLYMADKVPVQHELSAQLAQLLWCVAGTEEEDEYAGQAYLDMCEQEENEEEMEQGEMEEEHDGSDDDDDEEEEQDVTMKEIANTLDDDQRDSDDDDEEENSDDTEDSQQEDDDEEEEQQEEEQQLQQQQHQQQLDDSEIPHCRGAHLASLFVRTLFRTIRREWGRMDKYRVDKFYTFMRQVLHQIFCYMAVRHWNLGIIRLFNDALFEEVLSQPHPNGMRFHLIDITLDELAKVNATNTASMPLTEATFLDVLEPYFGLVQTGAGDALVQKRVMENILEKFLTEYSVVSERAVVQQAAAAKENDNSSDDDDDDDNDDKINLIMDQVHVGTVGQFIFQVASDGATRDAYRSDLYQLHKTYVRRVKQVGRDVSLDDDDDDDDENSMMAAMVENDNEESEPVPLDAEQEEEQEEAVEDEDEAKVSKPIVPPDSREKKKRKKKHKKDAAAKDKQQHDENLEETQNDTTSKKDTSKDDDELPSSKKKKRKRSKKEKKKDKATETDKTEEGEQEITISLQDQAKAKTALKKKSAAEAKEEASDFVTPGNKKKKHKIDHPTSSGSQITSSEKRVKFGDKNRARSWKASMKGLQTMESPVTDITPEKSILLNKDAKVKVAKLSKKKKKRAVDYF